MRGAPNYAPEAGRGYKAPPHHGLWSVCMVDEDRGRRA